MKSPVRITESFWLGPDAKVLWVRLPDDNIAAVEFAVAGEGVDTPRVWRFLIKDVLPAAKMLYFPGSGK